jgi:hypothetical protein
MADMSSLPNARHSVPAIAGYTIYSYRVFRGKTGALKCA